jgi:hypothetical protein
MVKETFDEAVRRHGLGHVAREAAEQVVFETHIDAAHPLHATKREFLPDHHEAHSFTADHPMEAKLHSMHAHEADSHVWAFLKAASEGDAAKVLSTHRHAHQC